MTTVGLVGYTGFVGQNLYRLGPKFDRLYNTQNIKDIRGQEFDLVICAAPQAKKWWANQNPEADWAMIKALIADLKTASVGTFILLSSVDVFPSITDVDESYDCSGQPNHAYGQNRFELEQAIQTHFENTHVVRLPALFGPGLKKNAIFDMLHDNQVEKINPGSQFQWYDLNDLWFDLERIQQTVLPLVMLATEPIRTEDIHQRFFSDLQIGEAAGKSVQYDVHTQYSEVFGSSGYYIRSKEQIMERLSRFIAAESGKV